VNHHTQQYTQLHPFLIPKSTPDHARSGA
jgi:hypothetical protein